MIRHMSKGVMYLSWWHARCQVWGPRTLPAYHVYIWIDRFAES